jgi:hypothetical protein
MPPTQSHASTDLESLLDDLDAADAAVRGLYLKLADNPDLAAAYETGLRELHAKRAELAQQAGMSALEERRARRSSREAVSPVPSPTTTAAPDSNGSGSMAAVLEPHSAFVSDASAAAAESATPASEPSPHGAESRPTPAAHVEPPSAVPIPAPTPSGPIPSPPASDAQLAAFKAAVGSHGLGATAMPSVSAQRPWGINLHEMMCLLGPRETELSDPVALVEELDALDEVATPERQLAWVRFPIEVQKHWLGHLVARTRAMRDHPASEGVLDRLKTIRAVYPQWARDYVPGHVNGLQLKHLPIRGTWANDADDHWRALGSHVGHDLPKAKTSAPKPKKKERSVVEGEPTVVEPEWALLPVVRGKTALIVGGAPREPNRDRLETYLRLATLDWPPVDGPRKVEAVAQRIAKGAYDVVIVIQALISHPEAERILDAAKASRTRWAMVDGYGVAAVKQGLERFVKSTSKTR